MYESVIFHIRYYCVNDYCVYCNVRHREKVERWILTKLQKDGYYKGYGKIIGTNIAKFYREMDIEVVAKVIME